MIRKDQWVILPFSTAQQLPNLCISPPGVVPQRERRPRWIGDYSWSGVNAATQPLAPHQAMQFGHALDRFLRELLLANPAQGPLFLMKIDIADGFYRINVNPNDIPKLGLAFPTRPGHDPSVVLPLVLPMGWKTPQLSSALPQRPPLTLPNKPYSRPVSPQPLTHWSPMLPCSTPLVLLTLQTLHQSPQPGRHTSLPSLLSRHNSPRPLGRLSPLPQLNSPLLQPSHSLLIRTPAGHPVHGPPPM